MTIYLIYIYIYILDNSVVYYLLLFDYLIHLNDGKK